MIRLPIGLCQLRVALPRRPLRIPSLLFPTPVPCFTPYSNPSILFDLPLLSQRFYSSLPPAPVSEPKKDIQRATSGVRSLSYAQIREFFQLSQFNKDLNYGGKGGAPILGEEQKTSLKRLFELAKTEKVCFLLYPYSERG